MPKITVIVPVYNAEKYLDACISSITSQTFSDFEIILLPGSSTDTSTSICENWVSIDNRIRIVPQDINSVSYARNKGIENSKGELIAFCDADDVYLPSYLEKMYSCLSENDADIVECRFYQASEDLSVKEEYENSEIINIFGHDFYERFGAVSVWKCLFKKAIWDKYNLSFPSIKSAEDLAVYALLFSVCTKPAFIDEPLYIYRQVPDSLTKRNLRTLDEDIHAFSKLFSFIVSEFKRVGKFEDKRLVLTSLMEHHSMALYDKRPDLSIEGKTDLADKLSQIIVNLTNSRNTIWDISPLGWGTEITGYLCQSLSRRPDSSNHYIKNMPFVSMTDENTRAQFADLYNKVSPNMIVVDFLPELQLLKNVSPETGFNNFRSGFNSFLDVINTSKTSPIIVVLQPSTKSDDAPDNSWKQLEKEFLQLLYSFINLSYPDMLILEAPGHPKEKDLSDKMLVTYFYEKIMDIIHG